MLRPGFFLRVFIVMVAVELTLQGLHDLPVGNILHQIADLPWLDPVVHVGLMAGLASPAVYFLVAYPFIRERERIERELREKNQRFEEAQSAAKFGLWEVEGIQGAVHLSDMAKDIFNFPSDRDTFTTADLINAIYPDDRKKVLEAFAEAVSHGKPYAVDHRVVTTDGSEKWVEGRAHTIFDKKGNPLRTVGTARDITDTQACEIAKRQFVACVSHELRTPLSSIIGGLKLVLSGVTGEVPDKSREMLEIAQRNSDHLLDLVTQLLELEDLEAEGIELKKEKVNLVAIARESEDLLKVFAAERQIALKLEPADIPPVVMGDHRRLLQVMNNLLGNAIKFSKPGGDVEISIASTDGIARVTVTDHGIGIPENARSRIFERFTQVDASDRRKYGGTGLGLHISKAIISGHGGRMDFTSKEGQGSSFFFELECV